MGWPWPDLSSMDGGHGKLADSRMSPDLPRGTG
jgi:hypothetical protein